MEDLSRSWERPHLDFRAVQTCRPRATSPQSVPDSSHQGGRQAEQAELCRYILDLEDEPGQLYHPNADMGIPTQAPRDIVSSGGDTQSSSHSP